MANPFADLVPQKPMSPAAPQRANPFADLVPSTAGLSAAEGQSRTVGPSAGGAAVRGALDTLAFGFDDEIAAGVKTGFGLAGDYSKERAGFDASKDAAREAHPATFMAGQFVGALPSMAIPGMNVARGANLASKVGRGLVSGAATGAAYGAGSADEGQRLAGAVEGAEWGGGVGAAIPLAGRAVAKSVGSRAGAKATPTVAGLKSEAQELYKVAEDAGVTIRPGSFAHAVDDIMLKLRDAGINAKQQPKSFETFRILRAARDAAKRGATVPLKDMERLRQIAGNVLKDADSNERRISHVIVDGIDDFMSSLGGGDILTGKASRKTAIASIKGARDLWKRMSKADLIETAFERAKNAVGANYTSAGMQTALRQQLKAIANNKNAFRRFSRDEQAAILSVVRGGKIENVLRKIGKFAPTGYLTGAGTAGVAFVNPVAAAALAGTTLAARGAATQMSKRAADRADLMVRAGGGKLPFDERAAAIAERRANRLLGVGGRGLVVPAATD